jgi:tetratricopeptide (TPR) repeat protein
MATPPIDDPRDPDGASSPDPSTSDLDAIDEELDAAIHADDFLTSSRLALQQSITLHRSERYRAAVEYSELALATWRELLSRPGCHSLRAAPTELRLASLCALQSFHQGRFASAHDHLQAALRLADADQPSLLTAGVYWTASLVDQWVNEPRLALEHALIAFTVYEKLGSSIESARLRLQIANIAMDGAQSADASNACQLRDDYVHIARTHLEYARPQPGSPYTPAVDGIFCLAYVRYSRLTGVNEDRARLIASVIDWAKQAHDLPVYGQALTGLGDELAWQDGASERAFNCYRRAVDVLLASEAPAYAVWPFRPLKQDWEFHIP